MNPLADDAEGRVITAARLVLLPWPDGFVYVRIGDYVPSLDGPYLSSFRVMCEMVDAVREMRGVRVVA